MIPLESEEAKVFTQVMKLLNLRIHKIKQENTINPKNSRSAWGFIAKEKAMGWVKGVSDYLVYIKPEQSKDGKAKTLFIELKRKKRVLKSGKLGKSPSTVSDEQIEFLEDITKTEGVHGNICYGSEESENFVKTFIK